MNYIKQLYRLKMKYFKQVYRVILLYFKSEIRFLKSKNYIAGKKE